MTSRDESTPEVQPRLPSLASVACLLFASGLCSLVYQVVWLRSLRLVFGSSTPATAVVLAIFMGGLGVGGAYFGRRSQRSRNPLALYANLELGIAGSAAVSVLLVWLAREAYLAAGGSALLGGLGATAVRLVLAVLVLGAPTILMGGTLPAMAQAVERRGDVGRRIVALLYGVNALGAVVGALVTTFLTLELVGVQRSLWLACLLNALIALVARAWGRDAEGAAAFRRAEDAAEAEPAVGTDRLPATPDTGLPRAALLVFAGLAGFLFFLMELVWYRMLTPLLGGSSYTFGLILALALLGIGAGGWLFSLGSREARPGVRLLALSASLEALALAVPFALGDRLAFLTQVTRDLQGAGFGGLVLSWTLVATLVVLPASLVAGYQFPLLVALLGSDRRRVGPDVGRAYAWNTWGAVLGSLAGGLVLLPWLGAPLLWRLSVAALALSGIVLLAVRSAEPAGSGRRTLAARLVVVTALASLALLFAVGPTAYWRHASVAGSSTEAPTSPNALHATVRSVQQAVVAEAEGRESAVALLGWDQLSLLVNGKSDGSSRGDAPTQVMGGLLGAALHPAPRTALVIGLGTGMTAGWLAKVDTMERVDVVELEPSVVELSRYFEPGNLGVVDLPSVHIHLGDGREFVRTTGERYDIVFSEPSNPYRAGVADLFSRQLYEGVSERLAEGGIFLQWLQLYEVDPQAVVTVYTTISSVFPHVESWHTLKSDLVLMASNEPIRHDFDRVRRRMSIAPYREALSDVLRVEGIEGFYSGFVGDSRLAAALAGSAPVNSDDRPSLEFSFARARGRALLVAPSELYRLSAALSAQHPEGSGRPPDRRLTDEMRRIRQALGSMPEGVSPLPDSAGQARDAARAAYVAGSVEEAWRLWSSQTAAPFSSQDRLLVAEGMVQAGDPAARDALAALAAERLAEAALLRALSDLATPGGASASAAWHAALLAVRSDAWTDVGLLRRAFERLEQVDDPRLALTVFEDLAQPLPGFTLEQLRTLVRFRLAQRTGDFPGRCREALADLEPHAPWARPVLQLRLDCYEANSDARAVLARRELDLFDRNEVPPLSAFAKPAPR